MTQTQPSIRCNAYHDPETCPQCVALNAERDARFARPMSRDEIAAVVERIVADQVDATGNHEDTTPAISRVVSLLDLGLDELATVEILIHAEERFRVELSDDDVTLRSTVQDIATTIHVAMRTRDGLLK